MPGGLKLDLVYFDDDIAVVNKPSGLLSVPGLGPENQDCVSVRLQNRFAHCIEQPAPHRLDMATSGIMVYGLTAKAHRSLSMQFQNREVSKKYTAMLDGVPALTEEKRGEIRLRFRLDPENRPIQLYDPENGKLGITQWLFLGAENNYARIRFTPLTGRTHQLRVHSAHPLGFGCPIVGDGLYGTKAEGQRLLLHADTLEFVHPVCGKVMHFVSPPPF